MIKEFLSSDLQYFLMIFLNVIDQIGGLSLLSKWSSLWGWHSLIPIVQFLHSTRKWELLWVSNDVPYVVCDQNWWWTNAPPELFKMYKNRHKTSDQWNISFWRFIWYITLTVLQEYSTSFLSMTKMASLRKVINFQAGKIDTSNVYYLKAESR